MQLQERRKADRAKMAEAVRALECGATAEIEYCRYGEQRRVDVHIRADRGLQLSLDFNGESTQPDIYVLSWHMALDSDARLADDFCGIERLNTSHWRKATDVAYGLDLLLEVLRKRLECVRDGRAFSAEREAASIAKNGTAAEQEAQWAKWREEESACKSEAAQ